MTSTVTELRPRGSRNELPHLPPIARSPADDAREALSAFDVKQAGQSEVPYADISEDLAAALRAALATIGRPAAKPVLRPLTLLDLAQAEEFGIQLGTRSRGADLPAAMFLLGVAASHIETLSDILRAITGLPR